MQAFQQIRCVAPWCYCCPIYELFTVNHIASETLSCTATCNLDYACECMKCLVYGTMAVCSGLSHQVGHLHHTWANSYLLTTQLHVSLRLSTYLRRSTRSSVNDEQYEHRRNFGKNILVKLMTTPVEFTSSLRRTSGWCDQQTDKWHTWAASTCNGRSKRNGWLQRTGQTVVMNFGGQAQRWLVRPPSGWHKNLLYSRHYSWMRH